MNPFAHVPIFDRLAFYLKPKELYNLTKSSKGTYQIGMLPNYKAKLYNYKVNEICKAGDLSVLKWMHLNHSNLFTKYAMDWAASNGHLDVVKWLHENRQEGCSKYAMDHAALCGHLDVVKWLHENRSEGCTQWAMDMAAYNGNINVVKWLHKNRKEGWHGAWKLIYPQIT